jgi:S-DNA-T family DNA segregation ATPase FtsK/SpoIIIE
LRLGDVTALDPAVSWRPRPDGDLLRVPIGTAADGTPLMLDLKESARGGMGPHGLVVGATGSGKSELLRSLVTALAITHPPGTLALLLADFKGGATFSGLAKLPHVAGTITNLEADLSLVDRFRDALGGELQRRQELLAASGKLTSLHAYADLRRRRPELEPMPHLLVVVDEFSELLGARPDLAELFVTIGRIGRSIGIHLLLATQRLDIGRIRGLESHLSYRICLRTFSEAESREAIGSPEAYHLPSKPGSAFLRADNAGLRRFRSATMSIPCPSPAATPRPVGPLVLPFGPGLAERIWELRRRSQSASGSEAGGLRDQSHPDPTVLDVAIQRIRVGSQNLPAGRPARRVWLDPLPARLTLADLFGRSDCQPGPAGPMAVIGLVDNPERQRQDALCWDFTDGNGNLLIVGAGRSGKTTAICTLLLSLAARFPPAEVQLVCVDLASEKLRPFGALPQVAAVATRDDAEPTRRVFSRLTELLAEREAPGGRHRLGSAAMRIVLIIDGWAGAGDLDAALDEILRRGPAVGLHTVLTVNAPSGLRARLLAGFSGRIELRLADSFDSSIDRQMAKALPATTPGRALVAGRHYAQLALPDLRPAVRDGSSRAFENAGRDERYPIEHAIATIRERWPGPTAPLIRTLPSMVRLDQLEATNRGRRRVAPGLLLGIAEDDLGPVRHDLLGDDPHLLIYGDARAGKTTVLRSLLAQLSAAAAIPADRVLIVDYRGGLTADTMSGAHRIAVGPAASGALCTALAAELTGRMRPAGGRSDSVGPQIYLLVDDYDLVSSGAGNPLNALIPLLPHARDLRFHLIITRRTGGAARAQYEPLLQTLGDLGTPVLLLSGSPAEGRLAHGLTPRPLPPGRALIAARETAPQVIQTPWVP